MPEIWKLASEFSAMAFLGVSFLMLMRWMIIRLTEDIKENTRTLRALQVAQMETFKLLMMHDATVRGVNPLAGTDPTDAHNRAYNEYQRVMEQVDNIGKAIDHQIRRSRVTQRNIVRRIDDGIKGMRQ